MQAMEPDRIALVYGTNVHTVQRWIRDLDDFRTRSGIEDIRKRLMARVLDIAEDDRILLPRDRIAQAKLCLGAYEILGMQLDHVSDVVSLNRSELLAKIRSARKA